MQQVDKKQDYPGEKSVQVTSLPKLKYQRLEGPISQNSPVVQRYFLTHERKAAIFQGKREMKNNNNKKSPFLVPRKKRKKQWKREA